MFCDEFNRTIGLTGGPTRLTRGSSISSLGDIRFCIRIIVVRIKGHEYLSKAYLSNEEVVSASRTLYYY